MIKEARPCGRRVLNAANAQCGGERLGERRAGALGSARVTGCRPAQVARDLAPDIAAIEAVETGMGEMIERRGERGLLQPLRPRRLAVDEKVWAIRHMLELAELVRGQS
jgi:hypothetical protein